MIRTASVAIARANPVTDVDPVDPAFLLFHGTAGHAWSTRNVLDIVVRFLGRQLKR